MRVPCLRLGQHLCPAPCASLVSERQYGLLVSYARLFLEQGKDAALAAIDARLRALDMAAGHPAGGAPFDGGQGAGPSPAVLSDDGLPDGEPERQWECQMLRECRARLARLRRDYRPVGGGLAGEGAVVMAYPASPDALVIFVVRDGRLVERLRVTRDALDEALGERLLQAAAQRPAGAPPDLSQTNLLLRWIHHRSGRPELIRIGQETTALGLREALLARFHGLDDCRRSSSSSRT
jgi:hypothetical protein